jgi:hypothetical protein
MKKPTRPPKTAKPPTDKELETLLKNEKRFRRLSQLENHQEQVAEQMHEIQTELIQQGEDFRIIPLCYQDSDVILAVCESIGVTLIPIRPIEGTLFLDEHQFRQLKTAMAEFIEPTE